MAESIRDKAIKAREAAFYAKRDAYDTVERNAKTAKVNLNESEKTKAKEKIVPSMQAERNRTANRAEFIEKRETKKEADARVAAASGNVPGKKGTQAGHHVTDSKNHTKSITPASKPKPDPTPTSLNQLKDTTGTMMHVNPEDEGTERDLNTYRGTYKGKTYVWQKGKASKA